MKNTITLPVSGAEDMAQVVTDLLATQNKLTILSLHLKRF